MLELEAALARILAALPLPVPENVPLASAHHRFLAAQILSTVDLPGFDNSAMDGYAVRAADLQNAAAHAPVALRLRGRVTAGDTFDGEVGAGECVRIFTGSPLPRGADAVIMQEDSRLDAAAPGFVQFVEFIKPWDNIRFRGEDLKRGAIIGEPGDELTAGRLSLLAAAGLDRVAVGRQPVAGLLATGSELLEAGQPPVAGKIYESNRAGLAALAAHAGAETKIFPIVRDTLPETRAALETALASCDVLVTCGGVSVGETDFVKDALARSAARWIFGRSPSVRAGRLPLAIVGENCSSRCPAIPFPPLSLFSCWCGPPSPAGRARANSPFPRNAAPWPRQWQIPATAVIFCAYGSMRKAGCVRSGRRIRTCSRALAAANGLVDVPPQTTLCAGASVTVWRWD